MSVGERGDFIESNMLVQRTLPRRPAAYLTGLYCVVCVCTRVHAWHEHRTTMVGVQKK